MLLTKQTNITYTGMYCAVCTMWIFFVEKLQLSQMTDTFLQVGFYFQDKQLREAKPVGRHGWCRVCCAECGVGCVQCGSINNNPGITQQTGFRHFKVNLCQGANYRKRALTVSRADFPVRGCASVGMPLPLSVTVTHPPARSRSSSTLLAWPPCTWKETGGGKEKEVTFVHSSTWLQPPLQSPILLCSWPSASFEPLEDRRPCAPYLDSPSLSRDHV